MLNNTWTWLAGIAGLATIGGIGVGVWFLGGVGFLAWLSGSWLGRQIALLALFVVAVLLVVARIYSAGQARERAKQAEATIQAMKNRIAKDDEIRGLTPEQRRERLNPWTRERP